MKKLEKTICWVSSEWFADVDIPVIPELLSDYKIHWIIVLFPNGRFKESYFDRYKELKNLTIDFVKVKYQARHPHTIVDYFKIYYKLKKVMAEINYIDLVPASPYMIIPYLLIPAKNTIFAAHDGSIKSIMSKATKWMFKIGYGWHSKHVHMFSKSQADEFNVNYEGKNVTIIPLMPKYYGECTINLSNDGIIRFLSFGTMHAEKNIGLLIDAAEELYNEGISGFQVSICGMAPSNWDELYGSKIKHPDLFDLQLRMIDNDEIPNLFAYRHFAVYPYKVMSQSGALKVAYAYNKPVIVSDLPAFKEEVLDGVNGFIFKSENVEALKNIMKKCVQMQQSEYNELVKSSTNYIEQNYSTYAIRQMYLDMFAKIQ